MSSSNTAFDLSTSEAIDKYLAKLCEEFSKPPPKISVMDMPEAAALTTANSAELLGLLKSACRTLEVSSAFYERSCLKKVVSVCLDKVPTFSPQQKWEVIEYAGSCSRSGFSEGSIPVSLASKMLIDYAGKHGVNDGVVRVAKALIPHVQYEAALSKKLETLVISKDKKFAFNKLIHPGEPWATVAREDIMNAPQEQQDAWLDLLTHAREFSSTKPSKKWLDKSMTMLQKVGVDNFDACMKKWMPIAAGQSVQSNADLLKSFVWLCTFIPTDEMMQLLGSLAEACFKKIPGVGAMSPKVANACVAALSAVTTKEAIVQLGKLEAKAKKPSAKGQIEKALQGAADKSGMSVDEMQELNVPTYGFTEVGKHATQLGEYQAILSISGDGSVDLSFIDPKGKSIASVPSAVKTQFPAEVKALKATKDQIEKLIPTLRYRIEHSLINQRHWSFDAWRERYHDHPIAGTVSRNLIWSFNGKPVIYHDGKFRDASGTPLEMSEATLVELWHPIAADSQTVRAWRKVLHDWKITQPFKQAHREIYVLTDAEVNTETYSNRFAAHIVRQHQFAALCHQRGWKFQLQGGWDQELSTPTLKLPRWNMIAEFWVDRVEGQMTESGILLYLSTDQVKFCRPDGDPIPLNEILPIVFSEVMRDVDLFVGVTSIGNDPDWVEHGEAHREYWHATSFGDLSAGAVTRKAVLEEIVPMLKIGERCSFSDKFLVVRGDIRTYKIHLGSGNILMEPNDQYLCIVVERGSSKKGNERIHLPFEGDNMLSIILSKAMLLAEDSKITDSSIVSQIGRK